MRLKITVKSEKAQRNMRVFTDDFPKVTKKSITKSAEDLVRLLRLNAPRWTGHLQDSMDIVDISTGKNAGIGISMAFYGPMLESGIKPHIVGAKSTTFWRWANEKFPGHPEYAAKAIRERGVQTPAPQWKRPFIKPSMDQWSGRGKSLMVGKYKEEISKYFQG